MDPATAVLLAVVLCMIPLFVRAKNKIEDKFDKASEDCKKVNDSVIVLETKMDMLLDHAGYDLPKVNRAIKENIEELKKNDKPTIGCINIKELYRDKEG